MTPSIMSEPAYAPDCFRFNSIQHPKDEYVQESERVLSKFNSEFYVDNNDDKYYKVYKFILNHIIPEYNELISCNMLHEDCEGNPSIIFNIKFNKKLEFSKRNEIHFKILESICNFCDLSNFGFIFEEIIILLVHEG